MAVALLACVDSRFGFKNQPYEENFPVNYCVKGEKRKKGQERREVSIIASTLIRLVFILFRAFAQTRAQLPAFTKSLSFCRTLAAVGFGDQWSHCLINGGIFKSTFAGKNGDLTEKERESSLFYFKLFLFTVVLQVRSC